MMATGVLLRWILLLITTTTHGTVRGMELGHNVLWFENGVTSYVCQSLHCIWTGGGHQFHCLRMPTVAARVCLTARVLAVDHHYGTIRCRVARPAMKSRGARSEEPLAPLHGAQASLAPAFPLHLFIFSSFHGRKRSIVAHPTDDLCPPVHSTPVWYAVVHMQVLDRRCQLQHDSEPLEASGGERPQAVQEGRASNDGRRNDQQEQREQVGGSAAQGRRRPDPGLVTSWLEGHCVRVDGALVQRDWHQLLGERAVPHRVCCRRFGYAARLLAANGSVDQDGC